MQFIRVFEVEKKPDSYQRFSGQSVQCVVQRWKKKTLPLRCEKQTGIVGRWDPTGDKTKPNTIFLLNSNTKFNPEFLHVFFISIKFSHGWNPFIPLWIPFTLLYSFLFSQYIYILHCICLCWLLFSHIDILHIHSFYRAAILCTAAVRYEHFGSIIVC